MTTHQHLQSTGDRIWDAYHAHKGTAVGADLLVIARQFDRIVDRAAPPVAPWSPVTEVAQ